MTKGKSKTVAFVTRRFGQVNFNAELVGRVGENEYRALLLYGLRALSDVEGLRAVVLFLDCGEEMLVDEIKLTNLPLSMFSFVICEKNITPVLNRLKGIGCYNPTFSPFPCAGPDTLMKTLERAVEHFQKTGETHPPDH